MSSSAKRVLLWLVAVVLVTLGAIWLTGVFEPDNDGTQRPNKVPGVKTTPLIKETPIIGKISPGATKTPVPTRNPNPTDQETASDGSTYPPLPSGPVGQSEREGERDHGH